MKKYFCVETDEQVVFGDLVEVTLVKETEDVKVIVKKKLEISEDTVESLKELGIIREVEADEEDDDLINFKDEEGCAALENLMEDFELLEERVDAMESMLKDIHETLINSTEKKPEKKARK